MVLLMSTGYLFNSDDLEIRVPDGSTFKVIESYTSEFLMCKMCYFLLVINCTRDRILHSSRVIENSAIR